MKKNLPSAIIAIENLNRLSLQILIILFKVQLIFNAIERTENMQHLQCLLTLALSKRNESSKEEVNMGDSLNLEGLERLKIVTVNDQMNDLSNLLFKN